MIWSFRLSKLKANIRSHRRILHSQTHPQKLPPHMDNLLDLVSTSGKQGLTQTTGLPQGDKSDGNLTEGRLGGERRRKFYCVWSENQAEQRGTDMSTTTSNCKWPWACPPFPLPHTLGQQSGNNKWAVSKTSPWKQHDFESGRKIWVLINSN